jgi:hypothetical protein
LTCFKDDAAGGDQGAGGAGEPCLRQGAAEEGQRPGESWLRDRLEFPGVGVIAPEGLSQDQVPGGQPRDQGAPEPQ